jgi:hypothetical protein
MGRNFCALIVLETALDADICLAGSRTPSHLGLCRANKQGRNRGKSGDFAIHGDPHPHNPSLGLQRRILSGQATNQGVHPSASSLL